MKGNTQTGQIVIDTTWQLMPFQGADTKFILYVEGDEVLLYIGAGAPEATKAYKLPANSAFEWPSATQDVYIRGGRYRNSRLLCVLMPHYLGNSGSGGSFAGFLEPVLTSELPDAATNAGSIQVTVDNGLVYSDGVNWLRAADNSNTLEITVAFLQSFEDTPGFNGSTTDQNTPRTTDVLMPIGDIVVVTGGMINSAEIVPSIDGVDLTPLAPIVGGGGAGLRAYVYTNTVEEVKTVTLTPTGGVIDYFMVAYAVSNATNIVANASDPSSVTGGGLIFVSTTVNTAALIPTTTGDFVHDASFDLRTSENVYAGSGEGDLTLEFSAAPTNAAWTIIEIT